MDAFVVWLNDPEVALQLEYAVAAIALGTFAIGGITTLIDWWRG